MSSSHGLTFTAGPAHIDANGHVNNAVWVRWMEELAAAHWLADADRADIEAYRWIVTRHEIDFRGNVRAGEQVTGMTEIREPPHGSRFVRHIAFADAGGRELVRARTVWALIDRASGRPARVPATLAARFLPGD